jgi:hypothetical protein
LGGGRSLAGVPAACCDGVRVTTVPLVARKRLMYAGANYTTGQAFEARGEADARLLVLIGLARQPSVEPKGVDAPIVPDPIVAVAPTASDPSPLPEEPRPVRRAYRRKDVQAED